MYQNCSADKTLGNELASGARRPFRPPVSVLRIVVGRSWLFVGLQQVFAKLLQKRVCRGTMQGLRRLQISIVPHYHLSLHRVSWVVASESCHGRRSYSVENQFSSRSLWHLTECFQFQVIKTEGYHLPRSIRDPIWSGASGNSAIWVSRANHGPISYCLHELVS